MTAARYYFARSQSRPDTVYYQTYYPDRRQWQCTCPGHAGHRACWHVERAAVLMRQGIGPERPEIAFPLHEGEPFPPSQDTQDTHHAHSHAQRTAKPGPGLTPHQSGPQETIPHAQRTRPSKPLQLVRSTPAPGPPATHADPAPLSSDVLWP